jgi:hypothetical protein
MGLTDEQKPNLLRMLIPAGTDACIIVNAVGEDTPNSEEHPEPLGSWWIEISGLLPAPKADMLQAAVLRGELAVPSTCNPLTQGGIPNRGRWMPGLWAGTER